MAKKRRGSEVNPEWRAEGARWAKRRAEAGYSQPAAAVKLGMAPITLSRKERGVSEIRAAERTAMAALYDPTTSRDDQNATAPTGEPAGAGQGQGQSSEFWAGVQYAIHHMLRQILALQQDATRLHGEVVTNTVPVPRPAVGAGALGEDLARARAAYEAVRRAEEEGLLPHVGRPSDAPAAGTPPPPARHGRRRAGGSRG